jgi:Helix-turn-helix.
MTIIHLEQLSGISRAQISDIETGKKNPTIYTLCQLAKALKVPITDLFKCD